MNDNWQTKTLIIGAFAGLVTGLLGAFILNQAADKTGNRPQLTAGDGLKISLGVMAVLKLLWDLGTH